MTFYEPSRKLPVTVFVILLLFGGVGAIIFFSLKECRASGIFRSGETSDATELYQVYPVKNGDEYYLLSLEGVFKTRIYERKGGMTTRSGSTDVRLTKHDLKSGKQINREVLGNYHEAYTKILGVTSDAIWMYNTKDGLHKREMSDFKITVTEKDITAANQNLSEGFAKADTYLGNLDELFAFDGVNNAIMVTTISGKNIWIDGKTFQAVEPRQKSAYQFDMEDMIDDMISQVKNGVEVDMQEFAADIIEMAADLSSFSDIEHQLSDVIGFDSCEYKFEGQTVRTIVRSDCPQPVVVADGPKNKQATYIEPAFLSYYNTASKQYMNPGFLGNEAYIIMHARSIGSNTDLMMSMIDMKTQKPSWSVKTGIVLSNERSGYQVNGIYGNSDTMFICVNSQFFAFNLQNGKLLWKTSFGKGDYHERLYYVGTGMQGSKHYFIIANNYFTELSREGIFVHGRTDHKLQVIDAVTGKVMKRIDVTDSKPEKLPYYLGMSDRRCWFYSVQDGIHTRSLPDLKITSTPFSELLKNAGIETGLVVSSQYDDAIENKHVAMDIKNNAVYFTTQNGLCYQYDLINNKISEITRPSDEQYENYMKENTYVGFYRTRLSYLYHHELFFADGRSAEVIDNNAMSTILIQQNKTESENTPVKLTGNQFIEGSILANGVQLSGTTRITNTYKTPLYTQNDKQILYILHKDKISPEAHTMISKYDIKKEGTLWQVDVTELLMTSSEITRIYTLGDQLIFIFKTHPDLDDFFTCVSVDAKNGGVSWSFKF